MDISTLVRAGESLYPVTSYSLLIEMTVIAAFEDATKLVQRIREQRATSHGMQLSAESSRDLLESLALGPVIVRGHYEHDLKRFGEPYACGDIQAREQMKDVLISLQMSLIINLRTVYMDGIDLDFVALQTASDDCRVNAGVCLGQLSQRLSDVAKAHAFYPQATPYSSGSGLVPPLSPSLGYSSSRSTYSSAPFAGPRTPDAMTEQFGQMKMSPPFFRPHGDDRKMSMSSAASHEQQFRPQSASMHRFPAEFHVSTAPSLGVDPIDEVDDRSMRRRSSQALAPDDNILLMFPQPGGQPVGTQPSVARELDRNSYASHNSQIHSSPHLSRASSSHGSQAFRDRYGPDDYNDQFMGVDGRQFSNSTVYDMYLSKSSDTQVSMSYSSRAKASNHSSIEHARFPQEKTRLLRQEPRSDSLPTTNTVTKGEGPRRPVRANTDGPAPMREPFPRPSASVHIPIEPSRTPPPRTPPPTGPLPQLPSLTQSQYTLVKRLSPPEETMPKHEPSVYSVASSTTKSTSIIPPILLVSTDPLTLPTDKNLLGFCKGAFRLQAGMERKAFSINNRPHGFSGMTAYWRCEKCNFEGPVHQTVNTSDNKKKKGKPEKVFDPKVRFSESRGIRYRWAFLARCHVPLKGMVPQDTHSGRDGSFGSFGCLFCCAEGKSRGWVNLPSSQLVGSNASVKSGRTTKSDGKGDSSSGAQATPIFGNVASFMQHLESVHRHQEGWPNAEMVGRLRVVVGRVAPVEEEGWEINFVPI